MKRIFPHANYILCIWHINGNIMAKILSLIKAEFDDSDDIKYFEFVNTTWKIFKNDWLHVISAVSQII
jgi:hypothetical protein